MGHEGISINVNPTAPDENIASLEEVLQILKAQGDNAPRAVQISGYSIPLQYIKFILRREESTFRM
jgi:hypothetical protein